MALIGKECLNCSIKTPGGQLCDECLKVICICPKCNKNINDCNDKPQPIFTGLSQWDFNYFIICPHCGYNGRPQRSNQHGNHPCDYFYLKDFPEKQIELWKSKNPKNPNKPYPYPFLLES